MRAIHVTALTGPRGLRVVELEQPATDDSLIIEVQSVGIAFPDLLMTYGKYQYSPEVPFVPGGELAGVVRYVPPESPFSEGDRVVALTGVGGAMAQYVAVRQQQVFALPDRVSFAAGSGIPFNYLTMHFAYRHRAQMSGGETVLVHGAAGGIGSAAVALASHMGAARTIAVVSTPEKATFALEQGAHDAVLTDNWKDDVLRLTDGRGVDVVIDPVGGDRFTDSVRVLAFGGRLLVLGFTAGDIPTVKVNRLLLRNASVVGVAWGSWWMEHPARLARQWEEIHDLLQSGALAVVEPTSFPFGSVAAAAATLEQREAIGKVALNGW